MRLDSDPILERVYAARIEALEALAAAADSKGDPNKLQSASQSLLGAAETIAAGDAAKSYLAYAKLVEAASRLERWKQAVRSAEVDADRFLRSAREIGKEAAVSTPEDGPGGALQELAASVETIDSIETSAVFIRRLSSLALPIPLLARPERGMRVPSDFGGPSKRPDEPPKPPAPEVFLEFSLDDQPFGSPQIVSPNQLHDLVLRVKVRNWPAEADRLLIHPISVEQDDICKLQEFSLEKPPQLGEVSAEFKGRLKVDGHQRIDARPLQYCYRADFLPSRGPVAPVVSGNSDLEFRSFDPALNPVSGYREVDLKLLEIRDRIRKTILVDDRQLADFLLLMASLGKIAAKALQAATFSGQWNEKKFQDRIQDVLRNEPQIGSALEEHPTAAGGITDLSLRHVRLELKVENKIGVTIDSAVEYSNQTAQYVAGSDRRLGVICILDGSPKRQAVGIVANDIGVMSVLPPNAAVDAIPTILGIVIIRGNLPSPSRL